MIFPRLMFALAAALAASTPLLAQTYPSKPVKVIVPYAAGGTGDILARLISQELTKQTGCNSLVVGPPKVAGM
jgi:tripartite-type tricarboxylate transporter receptor subunit TctC